MIHNIKRNNDGVSSSSSSSNIKEVVLQEAGSGANFKRIVSPVEKKDHKKRMIGRSSMPEEDRIDIVQQDLPKNTSTDEADEQMPLPVDNADGKLKEVSLEKPKGIGKTQGQGQSQSQVYIVVSQTTFQK
uniref:Uncharacterized protein n=1 Tax=Chaetoceros debilis TaxID=122233 RepID=A0A7S3QGW3_9STRA